MNEKNRINGRTMNIVKSGGRQKSENGSRERCGGKRKTASKVGLNKAKKQWNGKETGDGWTARRWSNMNKNNGKSSTEMNGRALTDESGSRNENRKEKGHTEGGERLTEGKGSKSNKSGNNGMNSTDIGERAVDKGNMNTNIYKKGEGHTTGKNTVQQQKNKKKGRIGKGHKERKKDKNRIKYGIQKT